MDTQWQEVLSSFSFEDEESEPIEYRNSTYMVVSKVAYLIGIRKSFFENVHESPQMEWYERLEQDKNARIVRNLCRLRAEIERNYGDINKAMYYDLKNLNSLPDLVPQECIEALARDGISLIRANYKLNQYIIDLNRHINNRVNNVRSLFPIWLKWDYIKELFIMPNGMTEAGIRAAANEYYANKRSYPYQTYLNWPGVWSGNILYNDKRFVTLLYEAHEDYFTDISKVTDAGNVTKNGIYEFLDDSERTAIMVDCENSNPYKLYAMLESLDQEALLSKISKIMLFDDSEHTTPAWKVLERFTEIPIQHQTIKRLMDHKSLVDPIMMAMTVKEYYANQIDSFILLSSDSDYWALIETLPEARYIVMVEESKVGQAIKTALENAGVTYCYIDDFNTANNATLQLSVILSEVQQILAQSVQVNMKDVMADLYQRLHIDLSTAEKDQIYNRYIRPMRLVLDPEGNVAIELGKQ